MARAVVTVTAPAKLNLSLAVLARQADGFHAIESLMVAVGLADTLQLRSDPAPGIRLRVRFADQLAGPRGRPLARDVPTDASNLVVRAVEAVAKDAGIEPAIEIDLCKRIPSGAGLGGGSSDAAAAIRGAAAVWGLDWQAERLAEIGSRLGSDIPFFFAGGPAIVAGRGERVTAAPPLPPLAAVIAAPATGLSTAAVYQACVPEPARAGEAERLAGLLAAGDLRAALPLMHNSLEAPARGLCSEIDRLLDDLKAAGGLCPRRNGSGSACFTLCRTLAEARAIAARVAAVEDAGRPRWPAVFPVGITSGIR
jgi:4-diphosphocytidyl-2-C-methyl-D-erythritol kinase